MAKSESLGIVEKHIEKIALAVGGLFLLYAVLVWTVSTPTVEVGDIGELTVGEVDEEIEQIAARVEQSFRAGEDVPPIPKAPAWLDIFSGLASSPIGQDFLYVPSIGPFREPIKHAPKGTIEPITLAQIRENTPAPPAPNVQCRRELRRMPDPRDVNACHLAAVYPWDKLKSQWFEMLRRHHIEVPPVVLRVEVERAELVGGAPGRTELLPQVRMPVGEEGRPVQMPRIPAFNGVNHQEVQQAVEDRGSLSYQRLALQPPYWPILRDGQWELWRADEVVDPNLAKAREEAEDEDSPRMRRPGRRFAPPGGGYDGPPIDEIPDEYYEEMMGGRRERRPGRRGYGRGPNLGEMYDHGVPALEEQIANGKVYVWAHDIGADSGKDYRYRWRVVMVNPLLAQRGQGLVDDPNLLARQEVASPWSEWSEPVSVPNPTEFFVTGMNQMSGEVSVSVFFSAMGQTVKQTFSIAPGEQIGGRRKVKVLVPPVTEQGVYAVEQRELDFSTGYRALEFDFGARILTTGMFEKETVKMVARSPVGGLITRLRAVDEDKETYRELRDRSKSDELRVRNVEAGRELDAPPPERKVPERPERPRPGRRRPYPPDDELYPEDYDQPIPPMPRRRR